MLLHFGIVLISGFGGYRGLHGARESYTNVAAVRHYGAFGGYAEPYGGGFEVPVGGLSVGPALGVAVPGIFYGWLQIFSKLNGKTY